MRYKRKTYGVSVFRYTYETDCGLELDCEFDCEPGEPKTYWDPGCDDTFDLTSVKLDDKEIIGILDDGFLDRIKDYAYQAALEEAQEV